MTPALPAPPATTAIQFRIRPLPPEFVARVRATQRDDFDRPVTVALATGGEPMRDQLRRANPGERIILCSYQTVALPSIFAEIGPIFVSAEAPPPEPLVDALPPGYFNRTFALRAYDERDCILDSVLVEPATAERSIVSLLARPEVAYLHARFAGHGCFAACFERHVAD